jgi:hypothetical protein
MTCRRKKGTANESRLMKRLTKHRIMRVRRHFVSASSTTFFCLYAKTVLIPH